MLQDVQRSDAQKTLAKALTHLVDEKTGIIRALYELKNYSDDPDFFYYTGILTDTSRYSPVKANVINGGVALTREDAEASAVGECIERYCAGMYDEADLMYASWEEVQRDAVNPQDFVLFLDEQYKEEGFPLSRFSKKTPIGWTWAYSLIDSRPVLVPACFVYVPYHFRNREEMFIYPVSTGLACGSSREEALLRGIYEVVERDALMITWHNRLPVPRIDIHSIAPPEIKKIMKRFAPSGVEIFLSDVTTDIAVCTVLALSVRSSEPVAAVGAAASLGPEEAVRRALLEMALGRYWLRQELLKNPHYSPGEPFRDVQNLSMHGLIYGYSNMLSAFEFMMNAKTRLFDDMRNGSSGSIREDIEICLDIFREKGMDVLFKEITTPEIAELGFCVVRVLIPGMQPLDITHNHRYLGGRRVYTVPRLLGYMKRESRPKELNRYPHPFA